jgi:hypothetical protein
MDHTVPHQSYINVPYVPSLSQRFGWLRATILSAVVVLLPACRHRAAVPEKDLAIPPRIVAQEPLQLDMSPKQRAAVIVEYYRKSVMGRRSSLHDVERIARDVTPIFEQAALQSEVERPLRELALDLHVSLDEARGRWVRLQEADILLESGGNPEDVSSANAVGVAQWIYETGVRAGLKVDLPESRRLTAEIDPLKRHAAWLEYLSSPDSDPNAPGNPGLDPAMAAQLLPAARARLEELRANRRAVDERYDPQKAIFAHTRYLLGLYRKFPDLQWVFQAFHGGEAGVARTLSKYMGPSWKGSLAEAIRTGYGGKHLSYETLYFTAGPTSHSASFSYLYGRGDDHRHYWWKMRAAEDAFTLYRRDPDAFRRMWESLLPGRAKEAMWRPDGPATAFESADAVERARAKGDLMPLAPTGIQLPRTTVAVVRPPTAALLMLIGSVYRTARGRPPLAVGDGTVPSDLMKRRPRPVSSVPLMPPDPLIYALPGGGPPGDFNYHATGWAVDLLRPYDDLNRKTLEYALGYLRDRGILWFYEETDGGIRRYHVVPDPRFDGALADIARTGHLPSIPGLAQAVTAQPPVRHARLSRKSPAR